MDGIETQLDALETLGAEIGDQQVAMGVLIETTGTAKINDILALGHGSGAPDVISQWNAAVDNRLAELNNCLDAVITSGAGLQEVATLYAEMEAAEVERFIEIDGGA